MKKTNKTSKFQPQIGKGGCTFKPGDNPGLPKIKIYLQNIFLHIIIFKLACFVYSTNIYIYLYIDYLDLIILRIWI